MRHIPIVSLFCGAGGLDLGFTKYSPRGLASRDGGGQPCPFEIGLAVDWDPAAVSTYNFNHVPRRGDAPVARLGDLSSLRSTDLLNWWYERNGEGARPPVGLVGGPPCQGFSVGNVKPRPDDPRVGLIYSYAQLVEGLHRDAGLSFFLFENVAGLTTIKNQPHFHRLLRRLRYSSDPVAGREMFSIYSVELDAQDYGVPQARRRRLIVGIDHTRIPGVFDFPPAADLPRRTVRDAIADLPASTAYVRGRTGGDSHPNHWHMAPKSWRFAGHLAEGQVDGRSFRVLRWDRPSWTVAYGNREVHVHPSGTRRLSVLEALLLQGFPPDYVLRGTLSEQIRLVSDAVPPPLAAALADSVYLAIKGLAPRSGGAATAIDLPGDA